MYKPEACIFDLDGVVVDTAQFHYKSWKRLADSLNITFNKKQNEALKGVSRRESLEKILEMGGHELPEGKLIKLMDKKNGWYREYIENLTPDDILEGVPSFLGQLKKSDIKRAVGSSSKNAQYIIDYLQLNNMFDAIIDGTEVEQTKPYPEVFLKGAQAMKVKPIECIVFEDAKSGVRAAKRAGMICVGVGSEEHLHGADVVIQSFEGLKPSRLWDMLHC